MFAALRRTFLEPIGKEWFQEGLVIESASARIADHAFARLSKALPDVPFDLLSKADRPGLGFRNVFRVKRPLGGLRLLFVARKRYDLVVLFGTGERRLYLCRAVALLVMRPRRFFVFNEFGDGFWLDRASWRLLQAHLSMRYDWKAKRLRWQKWCRGAVWTARLPIRFLLISYAVLCFMPAFLLLAVLRLSYDPRAYRFRWFTKTTAAPRRELNGSPKPQVLSTKSASRETPSRHPLLRMKKGG